MKYRIYKSHYLLDGKDVIAELGTTDYPYEVQEIISKSFGDTLPYYTRMLYNEYDDLFGIDYGSYSEFIIIKCENASAYLEYCDFREEERRKNKSEEERKQSSIEITQKMLKEIQEEMKQKFKENE